MTTPSDPDDSSTVPYERGADGGPAAPGEQGVDPVREASRRRRRAEQDAAHGEQPWGPDWVEQRDYAAPDAEAPGVAQYAGPVADPRGAGDYATPDAAAQWQQSAEPWASGDEQPADEAAWRGPAEYAAPAGAVPPPIDPIAGGPRGASPAGPPAPRRRFLGIALGIVGLIVVAGIVTVAVMFLTGAFNRPDAEGSAWSTVEATDIPIATSSGGASDDGAAGEPQPSDPPQTTTPTGGPVPNASGRPNSTLGGGAGSASGADRPCQASDLELAFAGSGTRHTITATNTGERPCTLSGAPEVAFVDASGRSIATGSGQGGGEVAIEAGRSATASVSWTGGGSPQTATGVAVTVGRGQPPIDVGANVSIARNASVTVGGWAG